MSLKTLKWAAIVCFVVAMAVLLGGGIAMKKDLPPYPGKVVDAKGMFISAMVSWTRVQSGVTVPREDRNSPPPHCTSWRRP
jgi:nitric oxide reductase large subunit